MQLTQRGLLRKGFLLVLLAAILVLNSCKELNPTYSISFVTVREADFRVGPVALPLDAEGKKAILSFLSETK